MTYKDGKLYIIDGNDVHILNAATLKVEKMETKKIEGVTINGGGRISYNESTKKFYTMDNKNIYVYDENLKFENKIKLSEPYVGAGKQDIEYDGKFFYALMYDENKDSYLYQYDNNGVLVNKIKYNKNRSEFEGISIYNGKCYILQNAWTENNLKISEFEIK